jgi:hypothetical protein
MKGASGRDKGCGFLVVETFRGKQGRENSWAQIGARICVLLLPLVIATAVLTARSPRLGSGDSQAVFQPLAESPPMSRPIAARRLERPSRPSKLSGIGNLTPDFPKEHRRQHRSDWGEIEGGRRRGMWPPDRNGS